MKRLAIIGAVVGIHVAVIGGLWLISGVSDFFKDKPQDKPAERVAAAGNGAGTGSMTESSSGANPLLPPITPAESGALGPASDLSVVGSGPQRTHVVKSGESFWVISRKYGVEMARLLEANQMTKNSPLRIGDKLIIPEQ